jgi:hypothetical protein
MAQVVLQPASTGLPAECFQATVETPVRLSRVLPLLTVADAARIAELHPSGEASVWGVKPGRDSGNIPRWERIKPGDIVLFSGNRRIFASAAVTAKARSREAADELWVQRNEKDKSEFLFFLEDVRREDITHASLMHIAGFKPGYLVNRFNVLNTDRSERIFTAFDLLRSISATYAPVS